MKSIGFTNTSNEATELIRLQREALEAKLKTDKENKAKDDETEKKLQAEIDDDFTYFPRLKNSMFNNGGSSTLRDPPKNNNNIFNSPRAIEEIDEDSPPQMQPTGLSVESIIPSHGFAPPENAGKNVLYKPEKAQTASNIEDNKTQSDWDLPDNSVFTTTPGKAVTGSDEEGAALFQSYPEVFYSQIAEEQTRQEKEKEIEEKKNDAINEKKQRQRNQKLNQ